jgi:hypothetical protein
MDRRVPNQGLGTEAVEEGNRDFKPYGIEAGPVYFRRRYQAQFMGHEPERLKNLLAPLRRESLGIRHLEPPELLQSIGIRSQETANHHGPDHGPPAGLVNAEDRWDFGVLFQGLHSLILSLRAKRSNLIKEFLYEIAASPGSSQ